MSKLTSTEAYILRLDSAMRYFVAKLDEIQGHLEHYQASDGSPAAQELFVAGIEGVLLHYDLLPTERSEVLS